MNAGISYHSMSLLGVNQRIVADDGHALTHPYASSPRPSDPGQTFDAIVDVPLSTADGTKLTIFDGNLQLRNRNRRPAATATYKTYGGAITFIAVTNTPGGGDTSGPVVSGLTRTTTSVTATISDVTTGNANVARRRVLRRHDRGRGSGAAMTATDAAFDTRPKVVTATLPSLSSGDPQHLRAWPGQPGQLGSDLVHRPCRPIRPARPRRR